ncbi:MAG: PfkB family carbohydrate kinase [Candidatus Dojkabacteria bacterium]|nr:PfkB family carbohydrate kinase [Candidatus Dojkabacteria bacterium]
MIKTIVIGSLNTDLIINGAEKLLGPGESTLSDSFTIAAGGKSRNIVAMLATLNSNGQSIAFIGKTIKDEFGFWKYPIDSMKDLDIDTSNIDILDSHPKYNMPGLAIIPIDKKGQNQIYLVPGVREDFSRNDIDKKEILFKRGKRCCTNFRNAG